MDQEILKRLSQIEDLPTLPLVVNQLRKVIDDPESDTVHVAAVIENDPAMMTRILKIVNSAYYAPSSGRRIVSLQPAVARLGFHAIQNIAISTSVFDAFKTADSPLFNREAFWYHSICVSIVAINLYSALKPSIHGRAISNDELHLAGLLHDLGKLILETHFNKEFNEALKMAIDKQIPLFEAEHEIMGTTHAEIGHWLTKRWNLDDIICEVIRWHHHPLYASPDAVSLASIIHMADYITLMKRLGESGNPKAVYEGDVRKNLSLDLGNIGELMHDVEEEIANSELLQSLPS